MRTSLVAVLVLALIPAAAIGQAKKKMVCWTDDNGVRACGDTVPPQYAKKEREIRNEQGVVIDTKAREKTPEELAAEAKAAEAAKLAKDAAEQAAGYDRYLTQSFSKVTDLEAARDERLITIKGRLSLAERSLSDSEKTLADLRKRTENARAEGKEPDAKLTKTLKEFETGVAEGQAAVSALKVERVNLLAKYEKDIARYRELRGLPVEVKLDNTALIAAAQEFFAKYVALTKAFDPKLTELYAPTAAISNRRTDTKGMTKELGFTGRDWRKRLREAMPVAQERKDLSTFSEVRYALEDYRVRVTGTRFSELKKFASPFVLLVGPNSDGRWFIYEERIETKE